MTAHKAVAAAVASFVIPVLTWVSAWLMSGDGWDMRGFLAALVGSALASLGAGGLTYETPNTPKAIAQHTVAGVALENSHSPNMEG